MLNKSLIEDETNDITTLIQEKPYAFTEKENRLNGSSKERTISPRNTTNSSVC